MITFLIAVVFVGSVDRWLGEYGAPRQSDVIAAREGYVVGFNDATHCPDWTMYQVTAAEIARRIEVRAMVAGKREVA